MSKSSNGGLVAKDENCLPNGWSNLRLNIVAMINPKKSKLEAHDDTEVNFVAMRSVNEEFGGIDVSNRRPLKEVEKGYTQFQEHDVLLAKITPCMENGKLAIVPKLHNAFAYGSTEFHIIRPMIGRVQPKWIAYFLSQRSVRHDAQRNMTGTAGQLRVPKLWLEELHLPVAPVQEQQPIVAKIDELFSDLDAGVAALERARANLRRYRASVLKSAVEGRLTAKWRAANPDVEPAQQLLDRILHERRQHWEQQQLATWKTKNKQPPKNWRTKYKPPAPPDTTNLPELPTGWCWATVEQLGNVQLGRQRSPKNRSKNYPTKYIRAANITQAGIDVTDLLDMEFTPDEQERYEMKKGDIVLSEASGSPEHVGKPAVWNDEVSKCCFQNTVIRLRPEQIRSDYLLDVFRNCYENKVFARLAGGVGINHLSAAKFSSLAIPIAPLPEQAEIALEVERHLSIIDNMRASFAINLVRAERLRQSVLRKAFEGELVTEEGRKRIPDFQVTIREPDSLHTVR